MATLYGLRTALLKKGKLKIFFRFRKRKTGFLLPFPKTENRLYMGFVSLTRHPVGGRLKSLPSSYRVTGQKSFLLKMTGPATKRQSPFLLLLKCQLN